jgi:16S rRNA (uracil1498-N3)-methyltransferase
MSGLADATKLLLDHRNAVSLSALSRPQGTVLLLVGPEGGLSDQERQQAHEAGFHGVQLGPRVLRTETAAVAAIAAVNTLWGDWS